MVVRLALVLVSHTWDGQTWANTMAQLAQPGNPAEVLRRPYEALRELSLLTQAAGRQHDYYEGWAYPPLMLYVYWPLAKLYSALGGHAAAVFPVQPVFWPSSTPIALQFLIRVPNIAADVASLFILRGFGASLRTIRWYAFNPFVLLVGAWTFDSVAVAFLLLGLLLATRHRWFWSGCALGLGAAAKFLPALAVPAVLIFILGQRTSLAARLRWAGLALAGATASFSLPVLPVWGGLLYVLRFHAERLGGNLSFAQLARIPRIQGSTLDWAPAWWAYALADVGELLLPLTLLLSLWAICRCRMSLPAAAFTLFLGFVAGSKLVNEPYALSLVALATVELAGNKSAFWESLRTLLWVVPLCYAAINTPLWAFGLSALQQFAPGSRPAVLTWLKEYQMFLASSEAQAALLLLGLLFSSIACAGLAAFVLRAGRQRQEVALA